LGSFIFTSNFDNWGVLSVRGVLTLRIGIAQDKENLVIWMPNLVVLDFAGMLVFNWINGNRIDEIMQSWVDG
jgi:hypothetical protein